MFAARVWRGKGLSPAKAYLFAGDRRSGKPPLGKRPLPPSASRKETRRDSETAKRRDGETEGEREREREREREGLPFPDFENSAAGRGAREMQES